MARVINRTAANNGVTLDFEKSQDTDALRTNMDEENDLIAFGKKGIGFYESFAAIS
ncbi:MAG: hypothetical protein Q7J27_10090 [Syntrophales bacterium]|nr:hypothetical protein [Syntrophales bacterium]